MSNKTSRSLNGFLGYAPINFTELE